jgi:endogenous inhibitor of DNA gyrase (YacG/DUF329 family)
MKCPICKTEVDESTAGQKGSMFPFCSDRCRTIDLARWLDGKYQIPVRPDDETSGRPRLDDFDDAGEDHRDVEK